MSVNKNPRRIKEATEIKTKKILKEKKKMNVLEGTIHLSSHKKGKGRILILDRICLTRLFVEKGLILTPEEKNFDHKRDIVSLGLAGDSIILMYPKFEGQFFYPEQHIHITSSPMHNWTIQLKKEIETLIVRFLEENKILLPRFLSMFRLQFSYNITKTPKRILLTIPITSAKAILEKRGI